MTFITIPAPATMKAGDISQLVDENIFGHGPGQTDAWFVTIAAIEYGGTGGSEVDVLDSYDVQYKISNNMLQPDERLVRVK